MGAKILWQLGVVDLLCASNCKILFILKETPHLWLIKDEQPLIISLDFPSILPWGTSGSSPGSCNLALHLSQLFYYWSERTFVPCCLVNISKKREFQMLTGLCVNCETFNFKQLMLYNKNVQINFEADIIYKINNGVVYYLLLQTCHARLFSLLWLLSRCAILMRCILYFHYSWCIQR
jgi:hypothetical protein